MRFAILITLLLSTSCFALPTIEYGNTTIYHEKEYNASKIMELLSIYPPEYFYNLRFIAFTNIRNDRIRGYYTYNGGKGSIVIYNGEWYDEKLLLHELRHNYWFTTLTHIQRRKYCYEKEDYSDCRERYAEDTIENEA